MQVPARIKNMAENRGAAAFLVAALVLGVFVGVATALLATLIEVFESLTRGFGEWTTWVQAAFLVTIPLVFLFSWVLNKYFGPGVAGGGVTETIIGLNVHGGYLPTRTILPKIAATAATLGGGGSGGREGPSVLIGATLGSSLARYTQFDHDRIRSLVAAGAGAGIAASFNAPIAGMLFAMEVILGSFAIRHLNAVIIASVSASVTTKLLVGEELILTSPPHGLGNFRELLLFALLAVISVTAGLLYLRSEDWFATLKEWNPLPAWSAPVLGGLAVAALGIGWPDSLGTGREFLSQLLSLDNPAGYVWYSVLILAVVKIFTATMTVASDGSAGSFMPALVVGGMVGTGFALALDPLWTFDTLNPGAFAVVGMACTLTTTTRAPMTAVLLVFELTGNYELVLPLMLGTALATLLGDRLHADSTYTMPLRRMGIALPKHEDIDLLDMVTVDVVMSAPDRPLRPWNSLAEAVEYFEVSGHHGSPVLNDQDELIGVLSLSDIADAGGPSHSVTVAAAMTKDLITVTPDLPVSTALARMASLGVGRLPVVGTTDPHRLLGMFRRQSVVKAYDHALSMSKGRELYRERKRIRMQPGADFFEVAVSADSWLTNAAISTVAWPQDCVLVSIQRGTQVLVPHGDTVLRAGDTLTAFGSSDANDELDRLITRPQEEESAP